ncbi:aminotransferase class V-fold PLP-dependent enzyme [Caulobacter sp. 17J65-9]|uniref:pyridoxal phosphate-dependent decarboxylase family protein n=1 Tax=Caulobacter sp. 17J65-9 TaxID=2709382 RepID=UPI0013CD451C|nr:aminotransferase class V-fold PLP-dependent enzyme [Caulobacter sp. 17J65-9]NEX91754.1 aminotransferase class V-fold PLP-dependent enzyme [Caulobacter sp. 17J65-9]
MTDVEALARAAAPLEPDAAERARLLELVSEHVGAFYDCLPEAPAYRSREEALARRDQALIPEEGRAAEEVLAYVRDCVDAPGLTAASPRFMGYIPGGGLFHSALGDLLAAVSNKYSGFASAGPGATLLENTTVAWLAKAVGFPESSAGVLTSGGSLATLTAIVAARDARDPDGGGAVYQTRFTHHCVHKALHIAGRGRAPLRLVETDEHRRMSPEALEAAITKDKAAGLRPWLVVASAGTVDTGSVDPLDAVAEVCARHGVWLHVDGAYGGLFHLCPEGQAILKGVERADSLVLDPHKALFLPYGTGAALVRDGQLLHDAFAATAAYLEPLSETHVGPSPSDLGPELTRHFRALRLWLPLQLAGAAAFRAALSEKLALARRFHERLSRIEGFDAGPSPDLSVVAFRYLPKRHDPNVFNHALQAWLQQDGRVFVSGTRIDGDVYLRCAILCFRTHAQHVDELIERLVQGVRELEAR